MADMNESFNINDVKSKMDNLEDLFTGMSEALSSINQVVNENINVGPESAIFGELGANFLNTWNANASTFGDFHANFESWSQVVAVISSNVDKFDQETINMYKDNGSTLTGVNGDNERVSISELRSIKAKEDTLKTVDENNEIGGVTVEWYDSDKCKHEVHKDKDGNVVYEDIYKDGQKVKRVTYDENGNSSVAVYYDEEGKELEKPEIKFYDKNGKELKTKPDTFEDDGNLSIYKADSENDNVGFVIEDNEVSVNGETIELAAIKETHSQDGSSVYEITVGDGTITVRRDSDGNYSLVESNNVDLNSITINGTSVDIPSSSEGQNSSVTDDSVSTTNLNDDSNVDTFTENGKTYKITKDSEGTVVSKEVYNEDDKLIEKYEYTGNLVKKTEYKDKQTVEITTNSSEIEVSRKIYNEDGNLVESYKNDKLAEKYEYTGDLVKKTEYKNDQTVEITTNSSGDVIRQTVYDESGVKRSEIETATTNTGEKTRIEATFDENGNYESYKEYNEENQVIHETEYENGQYTSTKYFNDDGSISREYSYKYDDGERILKKCSSGEKVSYEYDVSYVQNNATDVGNIKLDVFASDLSNQKPEFIAVVNGEKFPGSFAPNITGKTQYYARGSRNGEMGYYLLDDGKYDDGSDLFFSDESIES